MKKYPLILTTVSLLAIPATAAASPYNRTCGSPRDGWLVGTGNPSHSYETPYEVHGPWQISMSASEARRLTERFPTQEFGSRITLKQTPCLVGQAIAESGSQAWAKRSGSNGWTKITASTSGGSTYIGRFYCSGHSIEGGNAVKETCVMRYRGGKVVGKFKITRNPHY